MAVQQTDVRLLLSEELKAIRSKIVDGKLVLFVGEQVSTLVSAENPRPSLDDWWQVVNHSEVRPIKVHCYSVLNYGFKSIIYICMYLCTHKLLLFPWMRS